MPNPNALVAHTIQLDPEQGRSPAALLRERTDVPIRLDGERTIALSAADPRAAGLAHVLESAAALRTPVYFEVDPGSSEIRDVQLPHVARLTAVREAATGLEVEFEPSHAVHRLNRDSPWFDEFAGLLRDGLVSGAPLIVTTDTHRRIIDVRAFKPGPDGLPPLPWPEIPPLEPEWWRRPLIWFWRWWFWPWNWFRCISASHAQQVFDAMAATSCNPLTVPPPCIPFMYPDDGCWGRAHEMCRLMIAKRLKPRKIWIEGSLQTPTRNNPDCYVWWGWHVAPTLCVRQGWFRRQEMVIDPSLFSGPVTAATWKGVQGDPNAVLTPTSAAIFQRWTTTDPTYSQTNWVLDYYRTQLYLRSISADGPPPYANCP